MDQGHSICHRLELCIRNISWIQSNIYRHKVYSIEEMIQVQQIQIMKCNIMHDMYLKFLWGCSLWKGIINWKRTLYYLKTEKLFMQVRGNSLDQAYTNGADCDGQEVSVHLTSEFI